MSCAIRAWYTYFEDEIPDRFRTQEKLRPLDAKLKYQIDKLLKTPAASSRAGGAEASADPLRFK